MKTPTSRSPHFTVLAQLRQYPWGIGAPSLSILAMLILALIQRENVRLPKLALCLPGTATRDSKVRQLHRFFENIRLPAEVLACLVLSFVPPEWPVWLVIDRTNWRLGKVDINILLVAVMVRGQAMPLMWTLLPHRGNSDAATRNALLERVLTVLPAARIAGLLADREFVGKKWFRFLQANKIVPCIRLKADTRVGSLPVWQLFKTIPAEEVRWWYRPLMVYGVPLRVCAVRDQDGHVLYVATLGRGQDAMQNYAKRWSIESLFKHWKSAGFDLEATHLTHPDRIGTLLGVLTIAYVWAWKVGEEANEQAPIPVLAHGRLAVSMIRYGLDHLKTALVNTLWNPSETAFRQAFNRLAQKLSPT